MEGGRLSRPKYLINQKYDLIKFSSVCLLATLRKNFRTDLHKIFTEGRQWGSEQVLNFGSDPDHRLDTAIFSVFVTIGGYGKWLTDINLSFVQSDSQYGGSGYYIFGPISNRIARWRD